LRKVEDVKNTAIVITCYDRDGKEVKRVTSGDSGDIEDNENENGSSTGSETGGGSTQTGGGSDVPPVINP
jgi:hypothetical protein